MFDKINKALAAVGIMLALTGTADSDEASFLYIADMPNPTRLSLGIHAISDSNIPVSIEFMSENVAGSRFELHFDNDKGHALSGVFDPSNCTTATLGRMQHCVAKFRPKTEADMKMLHAFKSCKTVSLSVMQPDGKEMVSQTWVGPGS